MYQDIMIALLGLAGAFVNAATRLVAAVLGDQDITARQNARAWAQFWLALFFGPIAAVTFVPWILDAVPKTRAAPVAIAVGLAANVLWPIFVEGVVPAFKTALSGWFHALGGALEQRDGENK